MFSTISQLRPFCSLAKFTSVKLSPKTAPIASVATITKPISGNGSIRHWSTLSKPSARQFRPLKSRAGLLNSYSIASSRSYASYNRFQSSRPEFSLSRLLLNRFVGIFVGTSVVFYLYNTDEAPYTNRRRFLWIPYWLEAKIGDYLYRQILGQYQAQLAPPSDPNYVLVTRVMNRLLATAIDGCPDPKQAAHLKKLNWTVHIIRVANPLQEPPNAFILPNGKIFIFSSIFPICKNEDGLATVLSHELSHQLAHHSLEQLSKQPIYIMLSTILYAATGISWFTDLLVAGLFQMPASREMESEADRIGCELMARLCFNVESAEQFWQRMENWENDMKRRSVGINDSLIGQFLSTHPNTTKRIHDIRLWMPQLEQIKENSNCGHFGLFQDFSRNYFGKR